MIVGTYAASNINVSALLLLLMQLLGFTTHISSWYSSTFCMFVGWKLGSSSSSFFDIASSSIMATESY